MTSLGSNHQVVERYNHTWLHVVHNYGHTCLWASGSSNTKTILSSSLQTVQNYDHRTDVLCSELLSQ